MAATLTLPFINLEVSEKFLVGSVAAFPQNADKITFVEQDEPQFSNCSTLFFCQISLFQP